MRIKVKDVCNTKIAQLIEIYANINYQIISKIGYWFLDCLNDFLRLTEPYRRGSINTKLKKLIVCYRKSIVGECTRELDRLQKMQEGANIKLSSVMSDINGKSIRNILEYLLTGRSMDSDNYDELYEQKIIAYNLKASNEQIIDDLNGIMSPLQRKMMRILLDYFDELNVHIREFNDFHEDRGKESRSYHSGHYRNSEY